MNPTQTTQQPQITQQSLGLQGVGQAFGRALASQCHPRMLFAMLMPFLIVLGAVIVLVSVALGPLTAWLNQQVTDSSLLIDANEWLVSLGLFSLLSVKAWLLSLTALLLLLPASGILGLAVAAVFVMPLVVSHLSRHRYADVAKQGEYGFIVSFWNALWVSVVFMLGWVLTLPFWLFPPLGLLVSLLWWTFAFSRMMRLDSIVEHASAAERKILLARHGTGFWVIGLFCACLNLFPPAWVFLPVFSGLVYTHYGLASLRQLRSEMH
ncbi:MAG: EI24 domain-containing protein [Candidatus Methylopumilus sp.]|nr:EI24 domain-containing protein [Candidatus Methylopumilus sp.]